MYMMEIYGGQRKFMIYVYDGNLWGARENLFQRVKIYDSRVYVYDSREKIYDSRVYVYGEKIYDGLERRVL